ncbi:immunity 53 family protein [Empedobacter tilapiae]|uniref:Rhodanese-related sulfurtransferase n=1 Tax=Empedobacter tilapiae TaxID=2491114 RepID=A0A4Z1AX07_9FLAO|nr:immunity 53 family protein [Empedobacter tilapiae]TGN21626.1 hypothetical protein E4J94_17235 [Empedobacter tilapiae]
MIDWLQNWYESQCDGDWEHYYGIKIETLDNPGWDISVDINNYIVADISWSIYGDFNSKWIGFKIKDSKFNGSCDPTSFKILLEVLKEIIDYQTNNPKEFKKYF